MKLLISQLMGDVNEHMVTPALTAAYTGDWSGYMLRELNIPLKYHPVIFTMNKTTPETLTHQDCILIIPNLNNLENLIE